MKYQFDVNLSRRQAFVKLLRLACRVVGLYCLLFLVTCFGCVAFDLSDGKLGFLGVTALSLVLLFAVIVVVVSYLLLRKLTAGWGRAEIYSTSYCLSSKGVSVESYQGKSTADWDDIDKLWIEPEFTILFFTGGKSILIATAQIPLEALNFLAGQAEKQGVPIIRKIK